MRKRQEPHRGPYKKNGHAKKKVDGPKNDPPAIVPCPYCHESVLAVRNGYFDVEEGILGCSVANKPHRHRPGGAKMFEQFNKPSASST